MSHGQVSFMINDELLDIVKLRLRVSHIPNQVKRLHLSQVILKDRISITMNSFHEVDGIQSTSHQHVWPSIVRCTTLTKCCDQKHLPLLGGHLFRSCAPSRHHQGTPVQTVSNVLGPPDQPLVAFTRFKILDFTAALDQFLEHFNVSFCRLRKNLGENLGVESGAVKCFLPESKQYLTMGKYVSMRAMTSFYR